MVIVHLQPNRARKMGEKKASRKVSGAQILSLMSCVSLGRSLTVCTGFLTERLCLPTKMSLQSFVFLERRISLEIFWAPGMLKSRTSSAVKRRERQRMSWTLSNPAFPKCI